MYFRLESYFREIDIYFREINIYFRSAPTHSNASLLPNSNIDMQTFRSFVARYPKLVLLLLVIAWLSQGVQMILHFQPIPGPSATAMEIAAMCNILIAQIITALTILLLFLGTPIDLTDPTIHDGEIYLLFYFTAASVLRSPFLHSTEKSTVDMGLALELLLALAGALLCALYFLCKSLVWFAEGLAKEITEEPAQPEREKLEFPTAEEMRKRVEEPKCDHAYMKQALKVVEESLDSVAKHGRYSTMRRRGTSDYYENPHVLAELRALGYNVIETEKNITISFANSPESTSPTPCD